MVLLKSLQLPMGSPIIPFSLPATDGKGYGPIDFSDKKALVVIFMCNHCPYVKAVIDRLIAIQSDYAQKGVQLIGINANDSENYPEDSFEAMKEWVEEKGINFPYLHDESQEVASSYQAQCTPDIYVFDQVKKLAYHGRIDDNWQEEGQVTKQDLRAAIDAIIEDKPVPEPQHPSMGCSIKWK
ncbi:thioredoxin family protein [Patescibacteria group bacterium]|nr:thioredoxin family protein [Patescibacteria group bacterium]MBU1016017.1 thioredoxin family protein [Patescibacteria group bacterium]MBU1684642.1 thioredoxin family protein [Patescibacteria group bacterium]MBU1939082.1 thioredoxin family protein [Patescibacteria group bacterium]